MKKIALLLISMVMCLTSCKRSGNYRLVDIEIRNNELSQEEMEREKAKDIGKMVIIKKMDATHYRVMSEDYYNVILFTKRNGGTYSARNGMLKLKFTMKGAVITTDDGEENFEKWILERE